MNNFPTSSHPHIFTSLFHQPCRFIAGAATIEQLPPITVPEIAFIGRSNVGKSSLLNALVGQKALAKTSQNPGATKQLNFFLLGNIEGDRIERPLGERGESRGAYTSYDQAHTKGESALMLVDMPGYGFAKVSKEKKGEWDTLIRSYLSGRPSLKRACLLIDARRGVMPPDEDFMGVLDEAALSFQVVLTKADALKPHELTMLLPDLKKIIQSHPAAHPDVIATSAAEKTGIEELREALIAFAT